jgi:hypothetical protein
LFGFSGSDMVKSGAPGAQSLDLNALPAIPMPSFTAPKLPQITAPKLPDITAPKPPESIAPKLPEIKAGSPQPAKVAPPPPSSPAFSGSPATGPVCAPKENGCVQSTKGGPGAPVVPAWAYPPKLKGVEAGRMLQRALQECGATFVGASSGPGRLLKVSAKFSTGFFGMTTDTFDFVIDPSLGAVAFRATAPGDAGRARGRLGRVRARLSTGGSGKWSEVS